MSVSNLAKRRGKILDDIMRDHRERLPKTMADTPLEDLRAFASVAPPPTDLRAALEATRLHLIAGLQKASPVRGLLVRKYDPVRLARQFANAGATAVAIHTDTRHYQGQLEELRDVRETLPAKVPVIRLDFIFDPYQVYESRVAGADGLVLLTAVLGENDLRTLIQLSQKLGMTPLVDVHTAEDVARAIAAQAPIILVNRRSWQTFEVDEGLPAQLRPAIPAAVPVIVGGGISQPADLTPLRRLDVQGVLVGEALTRSKDPLAVLKALGQHGR